MARVKTTPRKATGGKTLKMAAFHVHKHTRKAHKGLPALGSVNHACVYCCELLSLICEVARSYGQFKFQSTAIMVLHDASHAITELVGEDSAITELMGEASKPPQ